MEKKLAEYDWSTIANIQDIDTAHVNSVIQPCP